MTFLGWKTNLKCDDCGNGKDTADETCGQQILLAKKHGKTSFWSAYIPNLEKGNHCNLY